MTKIRKHENKTGGGPRTNIELTAEDNRIIEIYGKENLDGNLLHETGFDLPETRNVETNSAGTSSAGPCSAGTSSAGTNSAGTNSAGTSIAGTSTAGTNSAGISNELSNPLGTKTARRLDFAKQTIAVYDITATSSNTALNTANSSPIVIDDCSDSEGTP